MTPAQQVSNLRNLLVKLWIQEGRQQELTPKLKEVKIRIAGAIDRCYQIILDKD